jgi:hypothetical protein
MLSLRHSRFPHQQCVWREVRWICRFAKRYDPSAPLRISIFAVSARTGALLRQSAGLSIEKGGQIALPPFVQFTD